MTSHYFDIDDAEQYGVLPAIILQNIKFWIAKNKANGDNVHDGRVWVYNSVSAWTELFPYATKDQVRRALEKLEYMGAVVTGNYNKRAGDVTKWYAISDHLANMPSHLASMPARNGKYAKALPDSKPFENTEDKEPQPAATQQVSPRERKRTFKDHTAVCKENNQSRIDAGRVDKYAKSVGLPDSFVDLAFKVFEQRYLASPKKYTDWTGVFLNALRANWYHLWYISENDEYMLTTAGKQALMESDE